ncbi:MAG: hypothetical protein ABJP48_04315 [Erythrobacter sp.]
MIKTKDILFAPALIGTAFLALACLVNGVKLFSNNTVIAATLLALSLLWATAYGAFLLRSKVNVQRAAITGLVAYLAIGLAGQTKAPGFTGNSEFLALWRSKG